MKNIFKKIGLLALSLFCAIQVSNAALVSTNAPIGTNLVLTGLGQIASITFYSTNTSAVNVSLIDSPVAKATYTNAQYVSYSQVSTNQTTTYTNFFGNVETWTNTVLLTIATTNSSISNAYPRLGVWVVQSNVQQQIYFPVNQQFVRGILVTNDGPVNVTIQYYQ